MPNSVVLVYVILLVYSSTFAQVGERGNAYWVSPRPDADYRLDGYEVTERFCSDGSGNLCVYFKRDGDKEILFYIHHRLIVITLGHHRRLVLINDWEATKSGKVVIANLSSGTTKQIDRQALSMYRRRVMPDGRLWIVAEAYEFSPDDKQVLISQPGFIAAQILNACQFEGRAPEVTEDLIIEALANLYAGNSKSLSSAQVMPLRPAVAH